MRDVKFGAGPRSNNWEAAGLRVPRLLVLTAHAFGDVACIRVLAARL
jgi:hypothetical protein